MLRWSVGVVAAILAALLVVPSSAAVSPESALVASYDYDGHHTSATFDKAASERGPPPAHDHTATAYDAVSHWSHGASACPDARSTGATTTYTITAAFAQDACVTAVTWSHTGAADPEVSSLQRSSAAAKGAPAAERLFTSRAAGVDSKLLGNSYARGESGLLNRTGSRLKFGWTSPGEFGGGWHLRLGIGRSPLNPNQARFQWNFGSTHVPNSVANDLLDVLRGLNGLQ